jgi:hypothetical protein
MLARRDSSAESAMIAVIHPKSASALDKAATPAYIAAAGPHGPGRDLMVSLRRLTNAKAPEERLKARV